ncbi:hypothetical protein PV761_11965 [Arthrobacter sp. CC3]|uniref:hypothetical protein n=1 Tax=Arthrobacter sp. CC3 TaxID=3029185 RepID=UPI003267C43A
MTEEIGKKVPPSGGNDRGIRRRGLLRLGTAVTGTSVLAALFPSRAQAEQAPVSGQLPSASFSDTYTTAALATLNKTGALAVAAGTTKYPLPVGTKIVDAIATLGTAPVSRPVKITLRLDGKPIFGTQPTIQAGATASPRVAADLITTVPLGGGMLTCDVDQVGATGSITYVANSIVSTLVGTTVSVTKPTGTQPGDILLVGFHIDTLGSTVTPPLGWTQVGFTQTLFSGQSLSVFWHRVDVEPGPYSFTASASSNTKAACVAYRGCAVSGDPVAGSATSQNTTFTASINSPSLTAPLDSMVVHFNGIPQHPATVTPDTRDTSRVGSALGNYVVVSDEGCSTAGATGTRTHTASASANSNNLSLVLLPAPIDGTGKDMVVAVRYQVKG